MEPLLSKRGVPYLPNAEEAAAVAPAAPRPLPRFAYALLFIGVFTALQLSWDSLRGTAIEGLLINKLLVIPAAVLIDLLTPHIGVTVNGAYLSAPGGGIQVVSACIGTEIYFLLTAALVVFPLSWRARLTGIVAGFLFVFALNQMRLLTLFYVYRSNLVLFDYVHGIFMPVLLVLLTSAFFLWWTASHVGGTVAVSPTGR